jgi:WD40 repeat protein
VALYRGTPSSLLPQNSLEGMVVTRLLVHASRIVLLLLACAAQAAPDVPTEPILRVETGTHLSMLTRISTDGRYLVTASEDKTARVWSLQTGRQLTVLRPPIGEDSLGAIYAAALSPDGSTIALGGNSAFDGRRHALYLFDRASGAMLKNGALNGLEAPVQQIAWSPDGRYLAVGLRQQGLRLFNANLKYLDGDEIYNDAIFGLDFTKDGRLAAASLDGSVRLYQFGGNRLQRIARQQLADGGQPYGLSFSPDARTLAVGFANAARVEILDAASLNTLHSGNYGGSGNLGRVVWSADGRRLYAGGTAGSRNSFNLLAFDREASSPDVIARFDNIIVSLAAMPDGGVAVGSAEPSWAVFDANGKRTLQQERVAADFRDAGDALQVSADGKVIAFPFERNGRAQVSFDTTSGEMRQGVVDGLHAARERGDDLDIRKWKNSAKPTLNGRPLELPPSDVSRSLAVTHDQKGFVLGTEWHLILFDANGAKRWQHRMPAAVWSVNATPDNRWIIAGLGDGTLRWFRRRDGMEQVALFPHPDRERWLLWTPGGHYDSSVAGEGLIGWHVNQAYNRAADFYPVGRFRKHFYLPAALRYSLADGDAASGVRRAQGEIRRTEQTAKSTAVPEVKQILPPIVELRSDREIVTSDPRIKVKVALSSPNGAPANNLRIRANGRLISELSEKQLRGKTELEVPIPLPAESSAEISLVARNRNGSSEPAIVHVKRDRVEPEVSTTQKQKIQQPIYKKLYVLAVGISSYPKLRPQFQLKYPSKDANDFANNLKKQVKTLYGDAEIRMLVDTQASRSNVLEGLKWLRQSVSGEDMGILFLAGHGFMLQNHYYFAPSDLDLSTDDAGIQTGVPGEAIQETLANLKGRGIFFLDTCHSGFALSELKINTDMTGTLNDMGDEKAVVVLAGSAGRQSAQEADEWNNGAFTKAILEGLNGKADYARTGRITPPLLHTYVSTRVKSMTENQQTPKMVGAIFDDPIVLLR